MMALGLLVAAGFAGGWVVRSAVDARGLAVSGVSAFYEAVERGKRLVAMEREHIEDLLAEGKARYEARRLRAAPPAAGSSPRATPFRPEVASSVGEARQGRAA